MIKSPALLLLALQQWKINSSWQVNVWAGQVKIWNSIMYFPYFYHIIFPLWFSKWGPLRCLVHRNKASLANMEVKEHNLRDQEKSLLGVCLYQQDEKKDLLTHQITFQQWYGLQGIILFIIQFLHWNNVSCDPLIYSPESHLKKKKKKRILVVK